ncbi:MAG: fumarate hydratase, class II [Chloroflexi bacterium]|nr:MAG: fumarate hydratase, class II [Chloroflexota bacterium]
MSQNSNTRIEKDSMGSFEVPSTAYYGANTMRAVVNFPISSLKFQRVFIKSLAQIKKAAALTNLDLGLIDKEIANTISDSAQKVIDGDYDDQFVVDIFQTGSGTSTNMNVNEVIANLSIESLGGTVGSKVPVHPNDHVNMGQSSNDVIPTAIHISAIDSIINELIPSIEQLENSLRQKSDEFKDIIKTGRTHLQDATPITLGQEFLGFAGQMQRSNSRIKDGLNGLSEVALGGTAVGTGINTHNKFAERVCTYLSQWTGHGIRETDNHFQSQSTLDAVVHMSGALKTLAVSIMKISNDIRWLGSGPRAGFGEIELPEVQPGSSIMPGKVNPVIAESTAMVAAQVIGNDVTVSIAGQSGNFELNVMMPVAAFNLLQSIELLSNSLKNLATQCVDGITPTQRGPEMVEKGLAIVTTLVPIIGYDKAAAIAKKAQKTGKTIREVTLEETDLDPSKIDTILDPAKMI